MQIYLRYCPICAKENIREAGHSEIYVPGMVDYFTDESYADRTCSKHKEQPLIKMSVTCEEFQIINHISNNPEFTIAMNNLKEKDIIEYELKMSQFRSQVNQQKQVQDNRPKCPHCGSTNVKKITMTSKAVHAGIFGFLGAKKILSQYHCNKCGSDF